MDLRSKAAFNSLSRDHNLENISISEESRVFQLPLSGSHRENGLPEEGEDMSFQLPLSGSHWDSGGFASGTDRNTFNFLSRDHRARFRDFSALRGFLPRRPFAQMISKATIWICRFALL